MWRQSTLVAKQGLYEVAEGIYQVCTPDEVVERVNAQGPAAFVNLHPLVGGMPIEEGWKSLQLYVDQVLPRVS